MAVIQVQTEGLGVKLVDEAVPGSAAPAAIHPSEVDASRGIESVRMNPD